MRSDETDKRNARRKFNTFGRNKGNELKHTKSCQKEQTRL